MIVSAECVDGDPRAEKRGGRLCAPHEGVSVGLIEFLLEFKRIGFDQIFSKFAGDTP